MTELVAIKLNKDRVELGVDGQWDNEYTGVSVLGHVSSEKNVGKLGSTPTTTFLALYKEGEIDRAFEVRTTRFFGDVQLYYLGGQIEVDDFIEKMTPTKVETGS